MKKLLKKATLVVVATFAFSLNSFAQTTPETPKTDVNTETLNLSPNQKALFKANKEKREAAHKQFKATLTAEQKAIMVDKSLTKEEKRNKLAAALSPEQIQMRENNKTIAKENRKELIKTLSLEQKKALKSKNQNWKAKRKANKADADVLKEY